MSRQYPAEPIGRFEPPPRTFEDGAGRSVRLERFGDSDADTEDVAAMYDEFDPADRAQGIPPTRPEEIRTWLESVLAEDCVNVLALTDDRVVGHATLVPDEDASELAIFVLRAYQEAGIGTALLTALLGAGQDEGVEQVWLSVERWNAPARALYRKVGFETVDSESFELEMTARLLAEE